MYHRSNPLHEYAYQLEVFHPTLAELRAKDQELPNPSPWPYTPMFPVHPVNLHMVTSNKTHQTGYQAKLKELADSVKASAEQEATLNSSDRDVDVVSSEEDPSAGTPASDEKGDTPHKSPAITIPHSMSDSPHSRPSSLNSMEFQGQVLFPSPLNTATVPPVSDCDLSGYNNILNSTINSVGNVGQGYSTMGSDPVAVCALQTSQIYSNTVVSNYSNMGLTGNSGSSTPNTQYYPNSVMPKHPNLRGYEALNAQITGYSPSPSTPTMSTYPSWLDQPTWNERPTYTNQFRAPTANVVASPATSHPASPRSPRGYHYPMPNLNFYRYPHQFPTPPLDANQQMMDHFLNNTMQAHNVVQEPPFKQGRTHHATIVPNTQAEPPAEPENPRKRKKVAKASETPDSKPEEDPPKTGFFPRPVSPTGSHLYLGKNRTIIPTKVYDSVYWKPAPKSLQSLEIILVYYFTNCELKSTIEGKRWLPHLIIEDIVNLLAMKLDITEEKAMEIILGLGYDSLKNYPHHSPFLTACS